MQGGSAEKLDGFIVYVWGMMDSLILCVGEERGQSLLLSKVGRRTLYTLVLLTYRGTTKDSQSPVGGASRAERGT